MPEEEEADPYREGNCIIDSQFVFQEILEDPSTDVIPPFPGTTLNNWNMNCTNQTHPENTTLLYQC